MITNRRMLTLQKTLKELHGIEINFDGASVKELAEAYNAAEKEKNRIISETPFNNYHTDKNYTQHILIMEAIRVFLREIAPKRRKRKAKSVKESKMIKKPSKVKENMRKSKRIIKEGNDLDQAEVILAAKDLSSQLQKMIEKVAAMQIQELMPLVDRIRDVFDGKKASEFDNSVKEELQGALDIIKKAKEKIDSEVLKLEGKYDGSMSNDMADDSSDEKTLDLDDDVSDVDAPHDEVKKKDKTERDETEKDDDLDMDFDLDDFGGADAASGPSDEPVGRAKKESFKPRGKLIKETADKLRLPPEATTVLEDIEYFINRRKMTLSEAKQKAMYRYNAIREQSDDVMISGKKMSDVIDQYIAENKSRLVRTVVLNGVEMPKPLKEAVEYVGLTESDFQKTLSDYFTSSKKKITNKDKYATLVNEVAEQAARNPKVFAGWVARLFEEKVISEIAGEKLKAFKKRAKTEKSKFSKVEKLILDIVTIHDELVEEGFEKFCKDNDIKDYTKMIKDIDGKSKTEILSVLDKVENVLDEHCDDHGICDEFASDKLQQLDEKYRKLVEKFEEDLTVFLNEDADKDAKKQKDKEGK